MGTSGYSECWTLVLKFAGSSLSQTSNFEKLCHPVVNGYLVNFGEGSGEGKRMKGFHFQMPYP